MSWAALAPWLVAASAAGAPPPGDYDARLCVTVSAQSANCGPAQAQLLSDGDLRVRVDDIVYHLVFSDTQVVGITLHGAMQVAEFVSFYRWQGNLLQFGDAPRGLRYELTMGGRR